MHHAPDPYDDEELQRVLFWLIAIVAIVLGGMIGMFLTH